METRVKGQPEYQCKRILEVVAVGNVLRGSGRGPGFIARVESEVLHPGGGVNARVSTSDNRGAIRRESMSVGTRDKVKV
jgi:hypothetical protein